MNGSAKLPRNTGIDGDAQSEADHVNKCPVCSQCSICAISPRPPGTSMTAAKLKLWKVHARRHAKGRYTKGLASANKNTSSWNDQSGKASQSK
jgi:hypothetical protein